MNAPVWSQASLPEDPWGIAPASDNSTLVQPSGDTWQSHGQPVTTQDLHAMDAASWLNVPHGSVELGMSPALSHESQSTHTINSISEPELPLLPPGLDLSFISEPTWDVSGPVVYSGSHVPQDFSTTGVTSPQDIPQGFATAYPQQGYNGPFSAGCDQQQPMYSFHGGHPSYSRRTVSGSSVSPQRPLLPRTEAHQAVTGHAPGQLSAPIEHSSPAGTQFSGRVSNAGVVPPHSSAPGTVQAYYQGPSVHSARMVSPGHTLISPRPEAIPATRSQGSFYNRETANEEFQSYPGYEDARSSTVAVSYAPVCGPHPLQSQVHASGDVKQLAAMPEHDVPSLPAATSTSSSGEVDEGRYRNHPLYSEGPHTDGLYHCPFKSDPNCQHKPTKLKCNYDKFLDSHLKPFRCKIEACSKQEFSSTACLLRHEREAHGMHGHGDRPHLCYYPGCERGVLGHGFPRRYNLFDHMKRVHDHKEDMTASLGADSQGLRKAGGRKRKAPSSVSSEPTARRAKVQQPTPECEVPVSAVAPQAPLYPEFHIPQDSVLQDLSRGNLYSQWNQQKELLEFQVNTVRSPEDMANLQYLSQQARQG